MARIRSIKPDFFTSETIARLPMFDRLLFIGLWTHVDDNGVCVNNPLLIRAALFPLDEDLTNDGVREALMRLSRESLVILYHVENRAYLAIRSWSEHQKIQHPGKPRYPGPDQAQEDLTSVSGESHESLTPEQGAGSREQGEESSSSQNRIDDADGAPAVVSDDGFTDFWNAYPRRHGVRAGKADAHKVWRKLTPKQRDDARRALTVYAANCGDMPKDAVRFLRSYTDWLRDDVVTTTPTPAADTRTIRIRDGIREVFIPGAGWCKDAAPALEDFEL